MRRPIVSTRIRSVRSAVFLSAVVVRLLAVRAGAQPIAGPLHNEEETDVFWNADTEAPVPAELAVPQPTEDVKFTARCDGSEQAYIVVLPAGFKADRPHDALVVLHGHGSDRRQYVDDPRDECRVARDTASAHGMVLVSPDYRATTSWMGPKAEADLLQILDEVTSRYRIGEVILCGGSMGGSSALTFAVLHPDRIRGVVSMNGTANHLEYEGFQDAIRESFGGPKEAIPLEYKRRSAEYWPELLTMPVAITAGGRDETVPPGSVVRLAGVLKTLGRDVLLIYRDSEGHATGYEDGKRALEFVIEKALGRTDGRPTESAAVDR